MKNLNEFTDEIVGLIRDVGATKNKIDKLKKIAKEEGAFYFEEMSLNAEKLEQALNDVFNLSKPKKKGGKK